MVNDEVQSTKRTSNNPKGRPISVPWRFDSDGNLIVENPTFSDYYKYNYYNKYSCKTLCVLCCRNALIKHMKRHQNSNICKKNRFQTVLPIDN